jgi:hypothetical protein
MNSKVSSFLLGLSFAAVYVLGCATARLVEPRVSAQAIAPPGAQRWEYFCADGYNVETVTRVANEAGAAGWEMSGAVGSTRVNGIWCFRRPV